MAEGDFPKSDGDVLFASEVNKFHFGNLAKDILPTETGTFSTSPTGLANVTDEDMTTATNNMECNSSVLGFINVDLGENRFNQSIFTKFNYTHGAGSFSIELSPNNSDWTVQTQFSKTGNFNGEIFSFIDPFMKFRYLRYRISPGAATAGLVITELAVFQ